MGHGHDGHDAFEVVQVLNRYGAALDAHDWAALERVFAEDAVADYSSIAPGARWSGRAAIIEWLSSALADRHGSFHFMTNHVVDVDGDEATSQHYMHNRNLSLAGRYTCRHVRTSEGWRIASLQLVERVLDPLGVDEGRDVEPGLAPRGVVSRLVELADRLELHELGPRYARLIDEQRWGDIADIFTADAVADYGSIGEDGLLHGIAEIAGWLERNLGQRVDSVPWHYVTDTIVDLDGDRARCQSYMHNRYLRVIGVYRTDAVRTASGWRYERLVLDAQYKPGTSEG
jgi:ketosteroid isomerase-like protein